MLTSLDLSAAFDKIDRSMLLNRLEISVGITGSALAWFYSFWSNLADLRRSDTQHVQIMFVNLVRQ